MPQLLQSLMRMQVFKLSRFMPSSPRYYHALSTSHRRAFCESPNGQFYCLFYEFVDDVLEKRVPFRASHLKHIDKHVDINKCKLAGAMTDEHNNVDSALIVFQCRQMSDIEKFVQNDPYFINGLVTNYRIRPWTVVAGSLLDGPKKDG